MLASPKKRRTSNVFVALVLGFATFALLSATRRDRSYSDAPLPTEWNDAPDNLAVNLEALTKAAPGARVNAIITLDRPIVSPGDVLRGVVVFIHALDNQPREVPAQAQVQILNQRGAVLDSIALFRSREEKFAHGFAWQVPDGISGGEYAVRFDSTFPAEIAVTERQFEIHVARSAPKIIAGIELDKDGAFKAGDVVRARLVGHQLQGARITVTVSMAGTTVLSLPEAAFASEAIEFVLPAPPSPVSDATLAVRIVRGPLAETIAKTLVVDGKGVVVLAALPESGEMVCGVGPTNVYLQATHAATGRSMDFTGAQILTGDGKPLVVHVKSQHKGRAKVVVPASAQPLFAQLPGEDRVPVPFRCMHEEALNADLRVASMSPVLLVAVRASPSSSSLWSKRKYTLTASKKEVVLFSRAASSGDVVEVLLPAGDARSEGVIRLTLSLGATPVAERLVFVAPQRTLVVKLRASLPEVGNGAAAAWSDDVLHAAPNDIVAVEVETAVIDAQGRSTPASASVSLRVSDASLASTLDTDRLPPRLAAAHFFESEVESMVGWEGLGWGAWAWKPDSAATAAQGDDEHASNIDLLLAVQGWRRFAYANVTAFAASASSSSSDCQRRKRQRMLAYRPAPPAVPMFKFAGRARGQVQAMPMMMMMMEAAAVDNDAGAPPVDMAVGAAMAVPPMAPPMADEDPQPADAAAAMVADADGMAANGNAAIAPRFMAPRRPMPKRGMVFTRVYAHSQRKFSKREFQVGVVRTDFTPTLYSHPELVTECAPQQHGRCTAKVTFALNDAAATRFVVHADGFSAQALGKGAAMSIVPRLPLEVDFKLPAVMTRGDVAMLPVAVQRRGTGKLRLEAGVNDAPLSSKEVFSAGELRLNLALDTSAFALGPHNVSMRASDATDKDAVTRATRIVRRGFGLAVDFGGVLKVGQRFSSKVALPANALAPQARLVLYTSPVGRLTSAIAALVREPCGCFEQTSSTTFPLVFALQYMQLHRADAGPLVDQATAMLRRGLDKLLAFETPTGGFEWFGESPGHEALTAYGLLQFHAMAKVLPPGTVSESLKQRVARWVLSRRDGKGGYLRNAKALDSFGAAPAATTDAYITWTLVETKQMGADAPEAAALFAKGLADPDPYVTALAALAMLGAGDRAGAAKAAARLAGMQGDDGAVRALDTITQSQGEALVVEGTALSAVVFTRLASDYADRARRAVDFLAARCKDGRFASTQATALSLMAIVEFELAFPATLKPAVVTLSVDGRKASVAAIGRSVKPVGAADASATATTTTQPCPAGLVWNECGSACTPTCAEPDGPCVAMCMQRCECPTDKPLLDAAGICVAATDCPATANAEGVVRMCTAALQSALAEAGGREAQVDIEITGEGALPLPFSLRVDYTTMVPPSSDKSPLAIATALQRNAAEGDVVAMDVAVTATADAKMVVAVVGVPAGAEVRMARLVELKERRAIDFFQVSADGDVVLYWRALARGQARKLAVELTCAVAGAYEAKASRVYEFYHDEVKAWAQGVALRIAERDGIKWAQ